MPTIKASVFMFTALVLLLAQTEVHASRGIPQIQGMRFQRNSMARQEEYHQAKQEETHAKMLKSILAQYQFHTQRVPDENVKSQIAKALRAHAYSMDLPANDGINKKQVTQLKNPPKDTVAGSSDSADQDGLASKPMGCGMNMNDMAMPTNDANDVNSDSTENAGTQTQTGGEADDASDSCINSSTSINSQIFAKITIPGSGNVAFCVFLPQAQAASTGTGASLPSNVDDASLPSNVDDASLPSNAQTDPIENDDYELP